MADALGRDLQRLTAIIAAQADIARAEFQPARLMALITERVQVLTLLMAQ